MNLSNDQQTAVDGIRAWAKTGSGTQRSLAGYAGCGKTFCISVLAREWQAEGTRVLFVSPTGKASLVLRNQLAAAGITNPDVMTIHKAIYEPPKEVGDKLEWKRHGREVTAPIIVIDEASMVTADLWRDLEVACDGAAFLAVGDHGQLPAIGESANLLTDPTWRLETIHRQAADNPVIEFGRLVREVSVKAALTFAQASQDPRLSVRRLKTRQESEDVVRWAYSTENAEDGMIVCGTNAERVKVNKIARRALGFTGAGPEPHDLVIVLRNHHQTGHMNGHRSVLTSVQVPDHGMVKTSLSASAPSPVDQFHAERTMGTVDAPQACLLLDYGYAITCHKAQGSQAQRVVVSMASVGWLAGKPGELARWLYTASTRAQESLVIVS